MRISIKDNQGIEDWVVSIKGQFGFEVAKACLAELRQRPWHGKARIVFDLADVENLESAGLGAMLLLAERMHGPNRPVIRCANASVWGVLTVARMDRQFDLVPVGRLYGHHAATMLSKPAGTGQVPRKGTGR